MFATSASAVTAMAPGWKPGDAAEFPRYFTLGGVFTAMPQDDVKPKADGESA